jgi:hypothetical protein
MGFLKKCARYAWRGGRVAEWLLSVIGGLIAGAFFLFTGQQVPLISTFHENPFMADALVLFVCIVVARAVIFIARLIWSPFHILLCPYGGVPSLMRTSINAKMWILAYIGVLLIILGGSVAFFLIHLIYSPSIGNVGIAWNTSELLLRRIDQQTVITDGGVITVPVGGLQVDSFIVKAKSMREIQIIKAYLIADDGLMILATMGTPGFAELSPEKTRSIQPGVDIVFRAKFNMPENQFLERWGSFKAVIESDYGAESHRFEREWIIMQLNNSRPVIPPHITAQ